MYQVTCWTWTVCQVTEIFAHSKRWFFMRTDHHGVVSFNSQGARRMSGGNGGIATAKIKRIKTVEGSGRERGRERGSRVNAMTQTTGTKQSTGIAEATTWTCSHLVTASCSSASDHIQQPTTHPPSSPWFPSLPPPTLTSSQTWPTAHSPHPLSAGVLLLPVRFDRDVHV